MQHSAKSLSWEKRTLQADGIWAQVDAMLRENSLQLHDTPRFPDVRVILNNISGNTVLFGNPAKYTGETAEKIPATGDETAAMVMLKGGTLAEQFENATKLVQRYDLGKEGLSQAFVTALQGEALDLVAEAYGPAPFAGQAGKLADVTWDNADGSQTIIRPVNMSACAYGARKNQGEKAFRTKVAVALAGSTTAAEYMECEGIVIALDEDYDTKIVSTRPIRPGPARGFYGRHYDALPVAYVTPEGDVLGFQLDENTAIKAEIRYAVTKKLSFG